VPILDQGTEGAETETPKALRGMEIGMGFSPRQPTIGDLGKRLKLPSGGLRPKTTLVLSGRDRTPLIV